MKELEKLKEAAISAHAAHLVAYDLACCDSSESACKANSVAADDAWVAWVAWIDAEKAAYDADKAFEEAEKE